MVGPKGQGTPAWGRMREMLHTEFQQDGARWVGDEVELPAGMWAEFAVTAQKCLRKGI